MKKYILLIASFSLLTACGGERSSLQTQLSNPLYAERYGDSLADTLANIIIMKDSSTENPRTKALIEEEIEKAKSIGNDARRIIDKGMVGAFMEHKEHVTGRALYWKDTLYVSSDFESQPGPDLHVYLSTAVDPRDVAFPDASAIDLGPLTSAFGAQSYRVPRQKNPELLRSVALWDRTLKRLYSFGQLSKRL